MSHYCTQRTKGFCDACDSIAEHAADYAEERDYERETWCDDALWNYEPTFGKALTRGGY